MLKKGVIFLGKQILKLWFLGYKIWTSVGPPPPLLPSLKFASGAPVQIIRAQIWVKKILSTFKGIKCFENPGKGVTVFASNRIQFPIVNIEMHLFSLS